MFVHISCEISWKNKVKLFILSDFYHIYCIVKIIETYPSLLGHSFIGYIFVAIKKKICFSNKKKILKIENRSSCCKISCASAIA